MSIQRAVINCERCYMFTNDLDRAGEPYGHDNGGKFSPIAHQSRNESMKALENVITNKNASKMLNACMNCDYSSPKIKDLVTKYLKENKK